MYKYNSAFQFAVSEVEFFCTILNVSTHRIISAPSTVAITEHDINTSQQTPPITTTNTVIESDFIIPLMTTTEGEYFYGIVI